MKIKACFFSLLLLGSAISLSAQQKTETRSKNAWEFGIGGTVYQFNRVTFSNFEKLDDGGHLFNLKLKNAVWGGNLYIARQLSPYFYLDLQGNVGFAGKSQNSNKNDMLYHVGLGLQWRLGGYFRSSYIDPFLRVGGGYMHKGFTVQYTGTEGTTPDEMTWILKVLQNKHGADRKNLFPITAGAGINMWFNDHCGVGLQGDYVFMPYKNVANSLQGTVRLMFRVGGPSKRLPPETVIEYVDRPVERIVEKVVEVEKAVSKPTEDIDVGKLLLGLCNSIHFDFDKATLTPESQGVIDRVANVLKKYPGERFLITGFTDSRGSMRHNQGLSERRARAVIDALVERGVARDHLLGRGVAQRIAIASPQSSDEIRRGDRKVTIDMINNPHYWDYLKKKLK